MKVAAIFPIGTSVGGAPDAIKQVLEKESGLDVYLLPGEQGAPNTPDPQLFAEQIRDSISHSGINWISCDAVEPFDLQKTYSQIRSQLDKVAKHAYERVYVGVTGGTNPMNVSLFQAAMAYLHTEVVPLYVQARGMHWQSNFVASEIRDRVTAEDALATARTGQIRVAARLAEGLPRTVERWKFLRASLDALSGWDDFDYARAAQPLEHQARKSSDYLNDEMFAPLAATVSRIAPMARRMSDFTDQLVEPKNFDAVATALGWADCVTENGALVVADALANAKRRMDEHRYTDSVLRSYRAAECATQMRLLKLGIHPSQPSACPSAYQQYSVSVGPNPLAWRATAPTACGRRQGSEIDGDREPRPPARPAERKSAVQTAAWARESWRRRCHSRGVSSRTSRAG